MELGRLSREENSSTFGCYVELSHTAIKSEITSPAHIKHSSISSSIVSEDYLVCSDVGRSS